MFNGYFLLILSFIAFLYSSVGHGGASGYLALFALFDLDTSMMKSSALLLNLFVSSISFVQYFRKGFFNLKLFLCFAITSIPLAFFGGTIQLNPIIYKRILGVCLIFAVLRILGIFGKPSKNLKPFSPPLALIIGGSIGFFSGLIGIGGGIILSPIILIMQWENVKTTAGISALFIFVNSLAGWLGNSLNGNPIYPQIYLFVIFALVGGFLGSYYGAVKFDNQVIKVILALVLLSASFKLFLA
jgi:uncharacterized membrane protein YfcA